MIKSVFAQETMPQGELESEDKGEEKEWTGEITYTYFNRPLLSRGTPDGGWEEFGFSRNEFTGKFSFSINVVTGAIAGKGDGYVINHQEYDAPHVELEPDCSYSDFLGRPLDPPICWRNYTPSEYQWGHAEGPVTYTVTGSLFPGTGTLYIDFNTESTIPAEGDSRREEYTSVKVGESIPTTSNPWKESQLAAFNCDPFPNPICFTTDSYLSTHFVADKLYDGATFKQNTVFEENSGGITAKLTIHGPDCETRPEPPMFEPYANGLWHGNFGVVDGEGLVLQSVNIGNAHLLDRLSMPHSKVIFSDGQTHYIRYCSSTDPHSVPQLTGSGIRWSFSRVFGIDTPGDEKDNGVLTISYNFVIRSTPVKNCEVSSSDCLRLIPTVTFHWNGDPTFLKQFTAFYKLDYGEQTGLTLVKDYNRVPFPAGFQQFQQTEISFRAIDKGAGGKFDNIHTGHPGDHVNIPGCRETKYDCLHMHWRWGDIDPLFTDPLFPVDPLVNPFTGTTVEASQRGKPYLVSGQTIDIAIVKAYSDPSEQDPDNPLSLAKEGETIASNALGLAEGCPKYDGACLKSAGHPIVWYVSSVDNRITTTFFMHGLFVLDRGS